ncbi:hypothetical protein HUJ05_008745 [Dendroctonus ponderosae]|nr:hypothetical protein HUJ05_008745 [Dendroctonus ponderosae]
MSGTQLRRLDALFTRAPAQEVHVEVETERSSKCDVHKDRRGSLGSTLHLTNRRDSLGNVISQKRDLHFGGVGARRESMPALNNQVCTGNNTTFFRRRDSLAIPLSPPKRDMEHPSQFSATLRRDNSHFSSPAINRWGDKRNSFGGSTSSLNSKSYLQVPGVNMRRNSRNYSTDSLDLKRNSWDPGRRGSAGSWLEDPIWEQVKDLEFAISMCTLRIVYAKSK